MVKHKLGLDSTLLHWFAHGFVLDWQNMGGVVVGLGFRVKALGRCKEVERK
jgi:hypothetical protein